MQLYTIGFTQKSASQFFETLKSARVTKLIDVRLNNSSQLAAFAKREDLKYFLQQICGAKYAHVPLLAPTQEMLDEYKKHRGDWDVYADKFSNLMRERNLPANLSRNLFEDRTVLLCSEHSANHCHRRIVAECIADIWDDVTIHHL